MTTTTTTTTNNNNNSVMTPRSTATWDSSGSLVAEVGRASWVRTHNYLKWFRATQCVGFDRSS